MLVKPPIEELLPRVDNRYVLSMLTAKRARQLVDGACPMAEVENQSMVTLAASELAAQNVDYVNGRVNVVVPLIPEVELNQIAAERAKQKVNQEDFKDTPRRLPILPVTDLEERENKAQSMAEQLVQMVAKREQQISESSMQEYAEAVAQSVAQAQQKRAEEIGDESEEA